MHFVSLSETPVCQSDMELSCFPCLLTTLLVVLLQAKAKIMVVRDIEREDIEFISKTLGCLPIAHIDHMKPEKLGSAELVEEVEVSGAAVRLLCRHYTARRHGRKGVHLFLRRDTDKSAGHCLAGSTALLSVCLCQGGTLCAHVRVGHALAVAYYVDFAFSGLFPYHQCCKAQHVFTDRLYHCWDCALNSLQIDKGALAKNSQDHPLHHGC